GTSCGRRNGDRAWLKQPSEGRGRWESQNPHWTLGPMESSIEPLRNRQAARRCYSPSTCQLSLTEFSLERRSSAPSFHCRVRAHSVAGPGCPRQRTRVAERWIRVPRPAEQLVQHLVADDHLVPAPVPREIDMVPRLPPPDAGARRAL